MYSNTDIRIRKCSISIASIQISAFYNPKGQNKQQFGITFLWCVFNLTTTFLEGGRGWEGVLHVLLEGFIHPRCH